MYRRSFIASITAIPFVGTDKIDERYMPPGEVKDGQMLRVWKLGSIEHGIYPTDQACQRLADILTNWDHHSSLDIIWGPELEVQQMPLNGDIQMDLIHIQRNHESVAHALIKEFPELEGKKEQIIRCLNAEPSKNDNS